jgi:hypothetical protein
VKPKLMQTPEGIVRFLRDMHERLNDWPTDDCAAAGIDAANTIEQLVRERDEARRMLYSEGDMYKGGVNGERDFMRGAVHALASLSCSGLTPHQTLSECQKLRARAYAGKRVPALMDYLIAAGQGNGDEVLAIFDQDKEEAK